MKIVCLFFFLMFNQQWCLPNCISTVKLLPFFAVDLPSSSAEGVLSASDLAAPPLVPMVLQRKDKDNLTQYFKSLWSIAADSKNPFFIYQYIYLKGWMGVEKDYDLFLKACTGLSGYCNCLVQTSACLIPEGAEISPDDFDWYIYKGKAVGIKEDLACGSICSGKLLLGSFMKKPLWVDHSAKTVGARVTR